MNGTVVCVIPVYVSVCIYTMYLTLFPEVIEQEISLPLSFPSPLLSLINFGSFKEYNYFVFEINELLITQNEKLTEVLESEALLRIDS